MVVNCDLVKDHNIQGGTMKVGEKHTVSTSWVEYGDNIFLSQAGTFPSTHGVTI